MKMGQSRGPPKFLGHGRHTHISVKAVRTLT